MRPGFLLTNKVVYDGTKNEPPKAPMTTDQQRIVIAKDDAVFAITRWLNLSKSIVPWTLLDHMKRTEQTWALLITTYVYPLPVELRAMIQQYIVCKNEPIKPICKWCGGPHETNCNLAWVYNAYIDAVPYFRNQNRE